MGILSTLEPQSVFHHFEEICSIPHGSTDTKKISDYCVDFAKKHKLRYIQDDLNNVIIFKKGTPGYENSGPVMIQGHLDMVCEKESGCDIDFSTDGLRLRLEDGTITADGTTLGGDDGIAVAYALAILESTDIPHPPLEVVFTVDEEIGMLGAAGLDYSPLSSRTMLNIDSEEEGYLLVSCAGGVTATCHLPVKYIESQGIRFTLSVTGLIGGHSGVEIDKGRANACQLLGRTLYQLNKTLPLHLISVDGGLKDNAIPREAEAQIILPGDTDIDRLYQEIKELQTIYSNEYQSTDPDIRLILTEGTLGTASNVMSELSTKNVITALVNLPGGIQRMSSDIENLVQTSLNLGILKTTENGVLLSFALRSSLESEKQELSNRISCLMEALGGSVVTSGEYPAWEYLQDSPLRNLMIRVFEEQYGRTPVIQALHAGLECGLFCNNLPGLDCISYGPDIKDIHTPKEALDAASVLRTWNYTLEILKQLK